jgi:hypothetical protein
MRKSGTIHNKIQTFIKFSQQTIKKMMKKLLAKNLHILSMPWIKITHLQGKNLRKKFVKRVTNPLKRNNNYLMIPFKIMEI